MTYCKGCRKDIRNQIWRSHIGAPGTICNYIYHQLPLEKANCELADRDNESYTGDRDRMDVDTDTLDAFQYHTGLGVDSRQSSDSGSSHEDEDDDTFWIDE
jgi:hypothetical protein